MLTIEGVRIVVTGVALIVIVGASASLSVVPVISMVLRVVVFPLICMIIWIMSAIVIRIVSFVL